MECSTVRDLLTAYLYKELPFPARDEVSGHLAGCAACRAEAETLRHVLTALDRWPAGEPAPGLAGRVAATVLRTAEQEAPAVRQPVAARSRVWPSIATGAMAVVAAAVSLGLAALRGHVHEIGSVAPVAVLAVILFGLLFTIAGGMWAPGAGPATSWRASTRAGLAAAVVIIASLALVSIPEIIEVCESLVGGGDGLARLLFLIGGAGLLYAGLPVLGATRLMGRGGTSVRLPWAAPGTAFLMAVAPVLYLQCAGLPFHLAVPWIGGIVAGALLAGLLWQGFGRRAGGPLTA